MTVTAPFPWYGSKRRHAEAIWERLGAPEVYVEPFAGSLAVLLLRPGGAGPREIVCDLDGGICNFWRAVTADPEAVAHHADWPTIHQDLTARHRWLRQWLTDHSHQLSEDPDFCDPKAAGWWVWGLSLWIGGQWSAVSHDQRPHVNNGGGGLGVSAQRTTLPDTGPHVNPRGGGRGVSAQRTTLPDTRPHVSPRGGGQGVSAQRSRRGVLVDWMQALQQRLEAVVVLNRDWASAVTPTLMMDTQTSRAVSRAVLLDPPYITADRGALYNAEHQSDDAAARSWAWAQEHGDRYRICYCAHDGDIARPDGWEAVTATFAGIRTTERREQRRDLLLFSPACATWRTRDEPRQQTLL